MRYLRKGIAWCVLIVPALCGVGCAAGSQGETRSVASAWQERDQRPSPPTEPSAIPLRSRGQKALTRGPNAAVVNGRPILRRDLIGLLVRSHGVSILEQLIGLDLAEAAAAERGLSVGQADIEREHDRALRRIAEPMSSATSAPFDRQAAERLLETVLAQRNVSPEEFGLVIRRNAYLRKIAEVETVVTEQQLRQEYERSYGERAQVRHIQLATLAEVERVRERLAAGEEFGELAGRYSANKSSASEQGLLEPFSANEEDVPALLRQVAFSLNIGDVSDAVRIGEWFHLIKLEALLAPEPVEFEEVQAELERSLRERQADSAMFEVFEKLFRAATIEVYEPPLKAAFERKHSDRTREENGLYEPLRRNPVQTGGGGSP